MLIIRREHIVKPTLDSLRPGSNFNLIYSSAFGLTLDWFYNLSPSFLYVQNKEKICLLVHEVICMKIAGLLGVQ